MLRMLRIRLMAIALASFSGGSVYACCDLAVESAPTVTGAGAAGVAGLCAASAHGPVPASKVTDQTISCANRLNLNPFSFAAKPERIGQEPNRNRTSRCFCPNPQLSRPTILKAHRGAGSVFSFNARQQQPFFRC